MVGVTTCTAGIGKTALAVHRVADQFPGGQLWANLHGNSADADPEVAVTPGRTLRRFLRFLRILGVPDAELPLDLDGQIFRAPGPALPPAPPGIRRDQASNQPTVINAR